MSQFVHLHVHSEYSMLDGLCRVGSLSDKECPLLDRVQELGMRAVALTDHGNMHATLAFYHKALDRGLNPVLGCEMYVAPASRFDKQAKRGEETAYHLVLLAATVAGYRHLVKLVSRGWLEGFYHKPRVDKELLREFSGGLIALSACLGGEIPQLLLAGRDDEAEQVARDYQDIFGSGNFYLEMMDNGLNEQKLVNAKLLDLARVTGIPVVATGDAHYLRAEDAELQQVGLCISMAKQLTDEDRLQFAGDFHLRSGAEMAELFRHCPEALTNTVHIAERCQVRFDSGRTQLPAFPLPAGVPDAMAYVRQLCEAALAQRYPQDAAPAREQLAHELAIIAKTGFGDYFLIVWDFIRHAREQGIVVGPGRGSAVGSIVAYLLGITDCDPLAHKLLFERFLNPERVTMPDIDTDFEDGRRDEVIRYVVERYGQERVAQIGTLSILKAKAALRDVGRVLAIPVARINEIAKLIPNELGITMGEAISRVPELAEIAHRGEPQERKLIEFARRFEGLCRHSSTHASAVVIGREPLEEVTPLMQAGDGDDAVRMTQFDMKSIEKQGLLKMDFLGLKTLTILRECRRMLLEQGVAVPELRDIPLDDRATFDLIGSGRSAGIFQLEADWVRPMLVKLQPHCFADIVAFIALQRPGPLQSGMADDFMRRHHGEVAVDYPHPKLKPILEETYGVIVYQEQVMQIAAVMAGYTLGQADLLRRAMAKKSAKAMAEQQAAFVGSMVKRHYARELADRLFLLIEKFAEYGFNKSHSVAYGVLTYQTAWFKAHYPHAFMAAQMSANLDDMAKVAGYVADCREQGLTVRPPAINSGRAAFTLEDQAIRFGLAAIKNVGTGLVDAIIAEREKDGPFTDLFDFCRRTAHLNVNRRTLEVLIKAGAMDGMGPSRAVMLAASDDALADAARIARDREMGQLGLFDDDPVAAKVSWPKVEDWPEFETLTGEKETLGIYVSGHPLAQHAALISQFITCRIADLHEGMLNQAVRLGGMIEKVEIRADKKGKPFASFTLEGLQGYAEMVAFSETYAAYKQLLAPSEMVMVEARLRQFRNERPQLMLLQATPLARVPAEYTRSVLVEVNLIGLPQEALRAIQAALRLAPSAPAAAGVRPVPVALEIRADHGKRFRIAAGREFILRPTAEAVAALRGLPGVVTVALQPKPVDQGRR